MRRAGLIYCRTWCEVATDKEAAEPAEHGEPAEEVGPDKSIEAEAAIRACAENTNSLRFILKSSSSWGSATRRICRPDISLAKTVPEPKMVDIKRVSTNSSPRRHVHMGMNVSLNVQNGQLRTDPSRPDAERRMVLRLLGPEKQQSATPVQPTTRALGHPAVLLSSRWGPPGMNGPIRNRVYRLIVRCAVSCLSSPTKHLPNLNFVCTKRSNRKITAGHA